MSKKESGSAKLTKREQLRAERRRASLTWNIILLGGGGLLILAIAAYILATAQPAALGGELSAPRDFPDEGRGHVAVGDSTTLPPLTFQHYPPSSGTHYGDRIGAWGVSAEPVPEGYFVHNLEHGGVVFLYTCPADCPELIQQFRDLIAKAPPETSFNEVKILVTPYDAQKMPKPIVALAWNHQLDLDKFDEGNLLKWYNRFVDRGPETAP